MRHRIPRRSRAEIARTIRFALARRRQRKEAAAAVKPQQVEAHPVYQVRRDG